VAQAEAAGREAFLVRGADGAGVGDVGGVDVGCERGDKWVENVGAERYQGWEGRVCVWEGDLKAQTSWCIRAFGSSCVLVPAQCTVQAVGYSE
jgi:hypothetical protein